MTTTIDNQLHTYIDLLDTEQKKSLLCIVKSYLQPVGDQTISLEEYNKELEDSEAEIDRGECYTHEEVIEMSKKWTNGNHAVAAIK